MKEEFVEKFISAGNDYDGTVERFDGNMELFEQMLLMFMDDTNIVKLREHVAAADYKLAFQDVHTLKGVAGNLGLMNLFHAASEMTEKLRADDYSTVEEDLKKVDEQFEAFESMVRDYL